MPKIINEQQWNSLVREQLESSLTEEKFCQKKSLNLQLFFRNKQRYQQQQQVKSYFVEIETSRTNKADVPQSSEICLKMNNATLSFSQDLSPLWVASLIKAMNV